MKRPIFYDTETTGLRSDRDRIVEIAAYDPVKNCSWVRLVNPQMPIPDESRQIHGISNEMVADSPSFALLIPEMLEFCPTDEVILIAHNNDAFDIRFLKAEFERAGHRMPNWQTIDSLKWARRYRPDLPKHQLQYLREVYGIAANQAHRALDDVQTLAAIFSAMIDDLPWNVVHELLEKSSK